MIIHLNESIFYRLLTEATTEEIYQKYYSDIPYNVYCQILNLDPTYRNGRMGKYTKWLLNIYRKGTFREGDFSEAKRLLPIYDRYKNVVQVKDIMTLNSMGELYQVVQPYMSGDQATSKSDAARRTKDGAEKVYEDNKWLIIIPHTKEAAILYGKHTEWCTAAEKSDNMFDYYNRQGPLYINIDKLRNRKYQFHFESNQYMNEHDNDIREFNDQYRSDQTVADLIGMPQGAREFYLNELGSKAGVIILTLEEDLKLCVKEFNANRGNIIGMLKLFDEIEYVDEHDNYINVSSENAKEKFEKDPQNRSLYIVHKRGMYNVVNLKSSKLLLKNWSNLTTIPAPNIVKIYTTNSEGMNSCILVDSNGNPILNNKWYHNMDTSKDGKFIVTESDGYYELYMLDGGKYRNLGLKLDSILFTSLRANPDNIGFIAANSLGSENRFTYNSYISKATGKLITFDEIIDSFMNYVRKIGGYPSSRERDGIIRDFEVNVLGGILPYSIFSFMSELYTDYIKNTHK